MVIGVGSRWSSRDGEDSPMKKALTIDPLSATIHRDAGLTYRLMGRYEDAGRYCRDVLRFRPNCRVDGYLDPPSSVSSCMANASRATRRVLPSLDSDSRNGCQWRSSAGSSTAHRSPRRYTPYSP